MNGRIYDSRLGRFLQADVIIDGVSNTQGYNRYSYGKNNPLNGIDPSGFGFFSEVFDDILGFTESPVLSSAATIAGCWAAPVACPAIAAGISGGTTYAATGDLGVTFRSGVIAGVSALAFQQIGEYFGDASYLNSVGGRYDWGSGFVNGLGDSLHSFGGNMLTSGQIASQIAAHAIAGGVTASLQGGKFGHGFISAGFTKGVMGGAGFDYANGTTSAVVGRTAIAAIVGGTASSLSGGKFANGAITAAFAQLLNSERSAAQRSRDIRGTWRAPGSLSVLNSIERLNSAAGAVGSISVGATLVCPECIIVTGPVALGASVVELATDVALLNWDNAIETVALEFAGRGVNSALEKLPATKYLPATVKTQIKAAPETVYNLIDKADEYSK